MGSRQLKIQQKWEEEKENRRWPRNYAANGQESRHEKETDGNTAFN